MMLYVWKCPHCNYEIPLLPQTLPHITSHLANATKVEPYVDFVCSQCGTGTRRSQRDIPQREFLDPSHYRPAFFHAFLRCDDPRCEGRGIVHTLAESDSLTAPPKIAVNHWKLEGISCHEGHQLKKPLELKGQTVTL